MDSFLVRLIEAAEAGGECPTVNLLTGGNLVSGVPKSSRHVYATIHAEISDALKPEDTVRVRTKAESDSKRGLRKLVPDPVTVTWVPDPEEARQSAALVEERTKSIHNALRPDEASEHGALTLVPASLTLADGSRAQIPALRVPLGAIDAWWLARAYDVKNPKTGPTFFVGGVMPLGN